MSGGEGDRSWSADKDGVATYRRCSATQGTGGRAR